MRQLDRKERIQPRSTTASAAQVNSATTEREPAGRSRPRVTGCVRVALTNRVARLRQPAPNRSARRNRRHLRDERGNSDGEREEQNRAHHQRQSQAGMADKPCCGRRNDEACQGERPQRGDTTRRLAHAHLRPR